ncbi:MAG: hypothetical protein ABL977_12545 [Candidatus Eisenbacteria bacterium]
MSLFAGVLAVSLTPQLAQSAKPAARARVITLPVATLEYGDRPDRIHRVLDDLGCCREGEHEIPTLAVSANELYYFESQGFGDSAIKHIRIDARGKASCDTIPFPRVDGVPVRAEAAHIAPDGDLYVFGYTNECESRGYKNCDLPFMFVRRAGQYTWERGERLWRGTEFAPADRYRLESDGHGGVLLYDPDRSFGLSTPLRVAQSGRLLPRAERVSLQPRLLSGGGVTIVPADPGWLEIRAESDSTLIRRVSDREVCEAFGFDSAGNFYGRVCDTRLWIARIDRAGRDSERIPTDYDPKVVSYLTHPAVAPDGTLFLVELHERQLVIRRFRFE